MRCFVAILLMSIVAPGCGKSASPGSGGPAEPASPVSTTSAQSSERTDKTASSAKSAVDDDSPFKVIEEKER